MFNKIFDNTYVTGILTGIISSFAVTLITTLITNKRTNNKNIKLANTNIVNYLRSFIIGNGLPTKKVIESVISSTCKDYNLDKKYLMTIEEICEYLITEIIGNDYISNENKNKYISNLVSYFDANKSSNLNDSGNLVNKINNDSKITIHKSTNISFISALITLILTIILVAVFR